MTWKDPDGEHRWGEEDEHWKNASSLPSAHEALEQYRQRIRECQVPRTCCACGRAFKPLISGHKRCPDCMEQLHKLRGTKPATIETKPCAICGSTFTSPVHWQRCADCRLAGRTLSQAYKERALAPTLDLNAVHVSVVSPGVLKCEGCAATWEALGRDGEGLAVEYWACPNGCNARKGAP